MFVCRLFIMFSKFVYLPWVMCIFVVLSVVYFSKFGHRNGIPRWWTWENTNVSQATVYDFSAFAEPERRSLESEWIRYFPYLQKLVMTVNDRRPMGLEMTNRTQSEITIDKNNKLQVERILKATIIAKDGYGKKKDYGGDFFVVMLRRPGLGKYDGVICEVADEMTGSYSVSCILPWAGNAKLEAILMHPSESVLEMLRRYSTADGYGYSMATKMRMSKNRTEQTFCSVSFLHKSAEELCDFSNHDYGLAYKCIKPPSAGECVEILDQRPNYKKLEQFFDRVYFHKGVNFNVEITGSGTVFDVGAAEKTVQRFTGSIYDVDRDPMKPTGWVSNGNWISTKMEIIPHSLQRVETCLKNKRMYFMGDSTIRQWYFHFRDTLHLKDVGVTCTVPGWSQSRDCTNTTLNATLHYRAHGPPLFNFGPPSARPYIPDSLDSITEGGKGTIVFITVGFHMEMHSPDVFINRLRAIKRAIKSLFTRLPGSKVYIKGLHYHRRTFAPVCPTAWLTYRFVIMFRNNSKIVPWTISILVVSSVVYFSELGYRYRLNRWWSGEDNDVSQTAVYVFSAFNEPEQRSLESEWIRYFPHLQKLVMAVNDRRPVGLEMTNRTQSEITIDKSNKLQVGGILKATIIAKDGYGKRKEYGGDFFVVMLRRPGAGKYDGVVCEVADELTGSYSVSCILLWAGNARLEAILMHPSESVLEMLRRYSTEDGYGYSMATKVRMSKNMTEQTFCGIAFSNKSAEELCDFSNREYGQAFKCIKPPSAGECVEILDQQPNYEKKLEQFFDRVYFHKGVNFNVEITGSGTVLDVAAAEKTVQRFNGLIHDVNKDPMKPTGWVSNGNWISTKMEIIPHSLQRVETCLKNKRMYFMGDSTIRQWYFHFRDTLHLKDNTIPGSVWSQSRDCRKTDLNATLHYRAHGPPLFNFGPPSARPYIPDSLDSITDGGKGTIVFITIGFHLEMHSPDVYINRLKAIKRAIKSFFTRLPGSKVYIKGLHYHRRTFAPVCPTVWLTYRYDVILRNEFDSMDGVIYVETWDYTLLIDNAGLHLEPDAIKIQMGLLMMYFC